jgi:thioesterase domain-containing protein
VTERSASIIILPGANNKAPDISLFAANPDAFTSFHKINYPGWRRYVAEGFSPEALIVELGEQILRTVPHGPIRIVGISIGGHFGYAVALYLQSIGREIAALCALDTFMITSSAPSAGWRRQALTRALMLLRERRVAELIRFTRSRFWRALLRLAGAGVSSVLRRFGSPGRLSSASTGDSLFEEELSMRLLIRATAPWIASLDVNPVALNAPMTLVRTPLNAGDDAAWRRRCPNIAIHEVSGRHDTLFEPQNIDSLREAFTSATREWR